jgi:hypothetical protein
MDGFLGQSTQLRPGQSEYHNRSQICLFDFATGYRFETYRRPIFFILKHGSLEDLLMISSEVYLNWSQLCAHTAESKSVELADDAIFMLSHGSLMDSSSMVHFQWC